MSFGKFKNNKKKLRNFHKKNKNFQNNVLVK